MNLHQKRIIKNQSPCLFTGVFYLLSAMSVVLPALMVFVSTPGQAETYVDYRALPPFNSTSVKPNVLFILDNSNSMDEDVDGAAVGSAAVNSKSEIARNSIETIIDNNKATMRLGLMAYKQSGVVHQELHNSFYYCDFASAHYDPFLNPPTPKDPSTNKKRFPNPTDPGNFIYYDTALPYYNGGDDGTAFCYSAAASHTYECYHTKTGDLATPATATPAQQAASGYADWFHTYTFGPTDSDLAAGFTDFGVEMAWVHVGKTWFANSSPGPGMLHSRIADSDSAHITQLEALLAPSQFVTATDVPLRNAGLTPLAGTVESSQKYFKGILSGTEDATGSAPSSPIQNYCQKNYVVLVTDGLPSVKADGSTGSTADLIAELKAKITALRTTTVPGFTEPFDIQTYVIGFAIPPELGDKLNELAVAGGTDVAGKAILANNAADLAAQLENVFLQIGVQTSSGTASSVISGSRSGEGAVYQSLFYPEYTDKSTAKNKITWVGSVHASFVDALGRMREDTNVNRILDAADKIVVFRKLPDKTVVIDKYSLVNSVAEVTRVTLPAATALAGKHYLLNTVSDKYYVWFNVDGSGTDPLPARDMTGISVILAGTDTANDVATKTAAALAALGNTFSVPAPTTNEISITNKIPGVVTDASPATSGAMISVDIQGAGETTHLDFTGNAEDIKYLWNSTPWLNGIADADITTQRNYSTAAEQRYIFTFIDEDQDKIADSGEQLPFVATSLPTVADLSAPATIYPYIPVNSDSETLPAYVTATNRNVFLQKQTQRVINYTRGQDQKEDTTAISGVTIPAFRSRKLDLDNNGSLETTWRLGDIVYSSPTVVSKPQEALHLLYKDASYGIFAAKYQKRRTVLYTGANDGMLHAFNGGFYEDRFDVYPSALDNKKDAEFLLQPKDNTGAPITTGYAAHALGAELWAYIPYNLLPHLYWPTEPNYGHVYYVDLKPRIFDAKIFTADTDHPGGWGTVLVGGMRFGGGKINVDMNRTDGNANSDDRTMTSAYFILDITNPEVPPTVLGEISFPHLGYTTCYPTVAAIKDKVETVGSSPNRWFLIFGSGPAEADGSPGKASGLSLSQAISEQSAKLYVVDLLELATNKVLKTIDTTGTLSSTTPWYYQNFTGDKNAFISDPITVDLDLDYRADAVYFGTVSYDPAAVLAQRWGGKLRRIVMDKDIAPTIDPTAPNYWNKDSVLMDFETTLHQPIIAAPTVGTDSDGNNWVYFGTGRYFVRDDALITDQETFYGIKEPRVMTSDPTPTLKNSYATVAPSALYNSTTVEVSRTTGLVTGGVTPNVWTSAPWKQFLTDTKAKGGWYYNFTDTRERSVSQAALFGDLLTFTTYIPSNDICEYEGSSYLYGLYYLTGTAPYKAALIDVLNLNPVNNHKRIFLGPGLASKPSIHVGQKDGSTVYEQNSDGSIITLEEENPGMTKSGRTSWGYRE